MVLHLRDIRSALENCPREYIKQCDWSFSEQIRCAAAAISLGSSSIVLLSGATASGKTTTATKLRCELNAAGINCHFVSMDDYFKDVDPETMPRTETGEYDFESPLCMDMELLEEHLDCLEQGHAVQVPRFDFVTSRRSGTSRTLAPGKGDVIIFEGIHAFNEMIAARHKNMLKVLVGPMDTVEGDNGEELFSTRDTRLVRRLVRDYLTRGNSPGETLEMWENVIRSEEGALGDAWDTAHLRINSTHGYEFSVFAAVAPKLLRLVEKDSEQQNRASLLLKKLEEFPPVSESIVPKDSLIREFIGAGC